MAKNIKKSLKFIPAYSSVLWIITIVIFFLIVFFGKKIDGILSPSMIKILFIDIFIGIISFLVMTFYYPLISVYHLFKKIRKNPNFSQLIFVHNILPVILLVIAVLLIATFAKSQGFILRSNVAQTPLPTIKIENTPTPESLTPTIATKPKPSMKQNTGLGNSDNGYGYPCDDRYATAAEILEALNNYRRANGVGNLAWNEKLAEVARMRVAQTLAGGRDNHQGFIEFTNNQENYKKVGFSTLSENIGSSGNCPLLGVHLIEYKISKSPAHDAAQKDPSWIAVGIATNGGITSFIFGRDAF